MTAVKPNAKHGLDRQKRNHQAGLWAAELLGLIGHAAQDYAHEVAHRHGDDESLTHALAQDLRDHMSLTELKGRLAHLWDAARHPRKKDGA